MQTLRSAATSLNNLSKGWPIERCEIERTTISPELIRKHCIMQPSAMPPSLSYKALAAPATRTFSPCRQIHPMSRREREKSMQCGVDATHATRKVITVATALSGRSKR